MRSIFHFIGTHKALLVQLLLIILFIGAMLWAGAISTTARNAMEAEYEAELTLQAAGSTPLPELVSPPPDAATPVNATTPVEFTPNQNETDGIIFAGILLVLIIIVATLGVIRQRD